MIFKLFCSVSLFAMWLVAVSVRLSNPDGFAGSHTGYVTVAFHTVAALVLLALIWSRRNFLNDLED